MPLSSILTVQIRDRATASDTLARSLAAEGAKIEILEEEYMEVRRGSQAKLRLLGGMLISQRDFPVVAMIEFAPEAARVTVQSDMGFGSMIGMKGKYQAACDAFAHDIAAMLAGTPSPDA